MSKIVKKQIRELTVVNENKITREGLTDRKQIL